MSIEKTKEYLLKAGISESKIDELIDLFEDLEKKVLANQASPINVDIIAHEVLNLLALINDETGSALFIKGLSKLAKIHKALLPLFLQVFKEAQHAQKKYDQDEQLSEQVQNALLYTKFLGKLLIEPMLFAEAEQDELPFTSRYLGKIPVINLTEETPYYVAEMLLNIDGYIEFVIEEIERNSDHMAALKIYANCFGYLNSDNPEKTLQTKRLLSHYLAEVITNKQSKITPRLILLTEVTNLDSSNLSHGTQFYGSAITDSQTIVLTINQNTTVEKFLINILHEMQHLYNALYFESNNIAVGITNGFINKFFEFGGHIKFPSKFYKSLFVDIQHVVKKFSGYSQEEQTLDELSAHISSLLLTYAPADIRFCINLLLENIAMISARTTDNDDEVLLFCKAISNAFSLIENGIQCMSVALYHFTLDKTTETFQLYAEKNKIVAKILAFFQQDSFLKKLPLEEYEWELCMKKVNEIDEVMGMTLKAAALKDPIYSFFEQARCGNNKELDNLLSLSKANLNKYKEFDNTKLTPLAIAIRNNHGKTVELLLANGADFSMEWVVSGGKKRNFFGIAISKRILGSFNLLHMAAEFGNVDIIPLFLIRGLSAIDLNHHFESPLTLLCKFLEANPDKLSDNSYYTKSITALAYLLSYGNLTPSQEKTVAFSFSLRSFQKNMARLYTLYEAGTLRFDGQKIIPEIVFCIALQMVDYIPSIANRDCYQDLLLTLLNNRELLELFVTKVIEQEYEALQQLGKNKNSWLGYLDNGFVPFISTVLYETQKSDERALPIEYKKEQVLRYYSPRSLFHGAESLASLTVAKRQLSLNAERDKYNKTTKFEIRKLALAAGKEKVASKEDEGLSLAVVQACNELGISEITSETYHRLATVLKKLVVKEQCTPLSTSPRQFVNLFKAFYEEANHPAHDEIKNSVIKSRLGF